MSWGNGSGRAQSLCTRCISHSPSLWGREGGFCPDNLWFLFSGSWDFFFIFFFKTNCRCLVSICSHVGLSSSMLCSDKYHEDLGILLGMNGTLRWMWLNHFRGKGGGLIIFHNQLTLCYRIDSIDHCNKIQRLIKLIWGRIIEMKWRLIIKHNVLLIEFLNSFLINRDLHLPFGLCSICRQVIKTLVWKYFCVILFLFVLTVALTFYSDPPPLK